MFGGFLLFHRRSTTIKASQINRAETYSAQKQKMDEAAFAEQQEQQPDSQTYNGDDSNSKHFSSSAFSFTPHKSYHGCFSKTF